MWTIKTVLLPALVFLALSFHGVSSTVLEDLCNNLGEFYVTRDYCMATLSADPRSNATHLSELAILALDLTANKAAVIRTQLQDQVKKAEDAVDKKRAEAFLQLYSNMIFTIEWARDSMEYAPIYRPFTAVLGVAIAVPSSNGYVSVDPENNEVLNLIVLSHAIFEHLA